MCRFSAWLSAPLALLAVACNLDPGGPTADEEISANCLIPQTQIFNGGPGRDGIPALTDPDVVSADESVFDDDVRVLGIEINGEARAYPLPIMWWHEIVNDVVGGQPVLVTYCPLTGSGLVFDPVVGGRLRNFGVSGLLFENNLIMFDRQTESLWNQLLTGAQCGPLKGTELPRILVIETTLGRWSELHPRTTVVSTNTGFSRTYGVYPYGGYALLNNSTTLFPSSEWSRERPPKEPVLGIREGSGSAAYPFGVLSDMGSAVAVNDTVSNRAVLITYHGPSQTARAFDRTVDGQLLTFSVADTAAFTLEDTETGSRWNSEGLAISGPLEGQRLPPVIDAYQLFWFSWSVYHPNTSVLQ